MNSVDDDNDCFRDDVLSTVEESVRPPYVMIINSWAVSYSTTNFSGASAEIYTCFE